MKKEYLYPIIIFLILINIISVNLIFCKYGYVNIEHWRNYFSIVKDIVLVLVPIITVLVAINGINKWKSEFKGKANFEASYKLLKSAYQIRDNFSNLRIAFMPINEMLPDTSIDNYHLENMRYVISKRLAPLNEAHNNLNSILPEVEALFGKGIKNICLEINGVLFKYQTGLNEYLQLFGNTNNMEHFAKISNIVFAPSKDDELHKELEDIVLKIETELSKHIKMD